MELAVQPEPPIRAAAGGLAGAARAANREIYPSSRVIVGPLGDLEVERQHRGRDAAPGHARWSRFRSPPGTASPSTASRADTAWVFPPPPGTAGLVLVITAGRGGNGPGGPPRCRSPLLRRR